MNAHKPSRFLFIGRDMEEVILLSYSVTSWQSCHRSAKLLQHKSTVHKLISVFTCTTSLADHQIHSRYIKECSGAADKPLRWKLQTSMRAWRRCLVLRFLTGIKIMLHEGRIERLDNCHPTLKLPGELEVMQHNRMQFAVNKMYGREGEAAHTWCSI